MSSSRRVIALLSLFLASACATASPTRPDSTEPIGTVEQVYDGNLFPDIQVNTFRNIDPTRTVMRGSAVFPLPPAEKRLANFTFTSNGKSYDLYDYVSLNRVAAMVVLKDGKVAFETYQFGNTEKTRWMSMSVVKSMTASLVGAAIQDGYIK